jgi:ABC-2 type transport system ATP-binding protein
MPGHKSRSPALEVAAVSKSFSSGDRVGGLRRPFARKRKVALDSVTISLQPGEVLGVIGANGSGKSTLIRILSTLLLPDSGQARVFGYDVVREPSQVRRHINRVSVEAAFFKELSPWENLGYAARLYGASGSGRREHTYDVLARLGLPRETFDRPMKSLSRGQQQKVAIARSFLTSPSLLLMDEPTTGLDPRSKREVQGLVGLIRKESGASVLLSTHDLQEAEMLCDHVVFLDGGRVLVSGTPAELRRKHSKGAELATLEDVFMELTGKNLEEDREEEEVVA